MTIAMALGLSGSFMLMQPIPVDFKLDAVSSPPVLSVQPFAQSNPSDGQSGEAGPPRPAPRRLPHLATGFGRDVPLEFAVRQVVPAAMHVEYAETVDRQLRVSWQGGKPWPQVLHAVLVPIGLRVVTSGQTVKITE